MQNAHPLFVHFPIALLLAALALEIAWVVLRRDWLRNSATVTLVLGAVAAVAAMTTGLIAAAGSHHEAEAAHEIM